MLDRIKASINSFVWRSNASRTGAQRPALFANLPVSNWPIAPRQQADGGALCRSMGYDGLSDSPKLAGSVSEACPSSTAARTDDKTGD
jgi:hypothetical protein